VTFKFPDEEKDNFYNDGFNVYLADQTGDFINAFVPVGESRIKYYNHNGEIILTPNWVCWLWHNLPVRKIRKNIST